MQTIASARARSTLGASTVSASPINRERDENVRQASPRAAATKKIVNPCAPELPGSCGGAVSPPHAPPPRTPRPAPLRSRLMAWGVGVVESRGRDAVGCQARARARVEMVCGHGRTFQYDK